MPKELTHFALAAEALKKVSADMPHAAETLRRNFSLYMAGAIICDSAYYQFPLFSNYRDVSFLSETVHRPEGDLDRTFLTGLLKSGLHGNEGQGLSFISGIISHHIVDRGFHPFINYMSGNYHDEDAERRRSAQARHRFLEGLLDLWVIKYLKAEGISRFEAMKGADVRYDHIASSLLLFVQAARPGLSEEGRAAVSKKLFSKFRFELFILSLCLRKSTGKLAIIINRWAGYRLSGYAALFYPDDTFLSLPFFSESFRYRNPQTGYESDRSLAEITHDVIDAIALAVKEIFGNFESTGSAFGAGRPLTCLFSPTMEIIPRLENSGIKEVEDALCKFLGKRRR